MILSVNLAISAMTPYIRSILLVFMLAFGSFAIPSATASVENTHHDMRLYNPDDERNVCSYCHIPQGSDSEEGIFSRVTPNIAGLGAVPAFCYYSCHDGTVVPTALIEGPDGSIGLDVLINSHGVEVDNLEVVSAGLEDSSNVYSSGVFDGRIADTGLLDCISCHNPHSNNHPPFLKKPLDELCLSCHNGVDRLGLGRWTRAEDSGPSNLAHPIGMPVAESGLDLVRGVEPEKSFHAPDPVFTVPLFDTAQLQDIDTHWQLGGHLTGNDEVVGCSTCHSAHMPATSLLVAPVSAEFDQVLCTGCHGAGDNPSNPGMTESYHPVFEASEPYVHEHADHAEYAPDLPKTGTFELFVSIPSDFPIGGAGQLFCTTCHITHGGVAGAKCLRSGPLEWLGGVICNECHGTGTIVGGNPHHVVSPQDFTEPAFGGFAKLTPWAWGPGLPGDLSDGLQCTDCHTEWARSAHNW